ncbi:hypothetical protein [Vibrio vulnificus]|uniref:hypothetical protein n=1 Tax=Vibrio vulnificus TaxID=672 RepID=UPI001CDD5202|nr:hypothetical protein [Vibrio vulnificus]MCA4023985.1 hypothetical protein [Vibrio vulnificus]
MDLGQICYELDSALRIAETLISNDKSKNISIFLSACRAVTIFNGNLLNSGEDPEILVNYLRLIYGNELCVDGIHHRVIKNMHKKLSTLKLSDEELEIVEYEFENAELLLFMYDEFEEILN